MIIQLDLLGYCTSSTVWENNYVNIFKSTSLTLQREVISTARHSENIACRGVTSTARHSENIACRGVTSTARHSENVACRGVMSIARHAARSHSFVYISTT